MPRGAPKSGKRKSITVELPKGFRAITGGGDFAPTWDHVKQKVLSGTSHASAKCRRDSRKAKCSTISQ